MEEKALLSKKILLISVFLLTLLTISAVSANEINCTTDIVSLDESNDEIINDNLGESEYLISENTLEPQFNKTSDKIHSENMLTDIIDVNDGDSLYSAVKNAKAGSVINVNDGASDLRAYITKPLTINGNNHQIYWLECNADGIILNDIVFKDGWGSGNGTAINSKKSIEINNCTFINNEGYESDYASSNVPLGGAIYSQGNLTLTKCTFIDNKARCAYSGGVGNAIYCTAKTVVNDCTFKDNRIYASNNGVSIYTKTFEAYNSNFTGNDRIVCDAGIIDACIFENNTGCAVSGALNISNSIFSNNHNSPYTKGAIDSSGTTINCTFYNNTAYVSSGSMKDSKFIESQLSFKGGGNNRTFNVENCQFINYTGAPVYIDDQSCYLTIVNSYFYNNSLAISNYGYLYLYNNTMKDNNSVEIKNRIYNNDPGFTVSPTTAVILDNSTQSVEPNTQITLSAVVYDDKSNKIDAGAFLFVVNNEYIEGTLDENGTYSASYTVPKTPGNFIVSGICERTTDTKVKTALLSSSKLNIKANNLVKYLGGDEKFTLTLTDNDKAISDAKVKVTINGKTSTVTTNNKGQASLDLNLTVGTYDAIAKYDGVEAKSKVTVKSTVTTSDSTGTYLNSKVSATFLNASGKALANTKVSFKVGSKTYTATTNNNGVATASVDLDVGTYTVTAINPKNNEQKTSKLTISKAKSTVTLTATSNNGVVTLTASLSPSTASGNVIFNINNKNYTAKISSAKASQTITGLNVGNYTAKASYAGDKNLNSSSASTKVEVKKVIATKIIYEDMQTGPVPKSEGRIGNYFCVKLVDDKGKAIAGVPIKIGFNGVIYNRTTLSDGSARLQINLANEDLYTFAICFLGDDDYQAAFEVAKIDVNKKYPKPNLANKTTDATNASATQHESRLKTYINYSNMDTKSVLKVEGRAGEYFVVKLLDNNKKPLADVPIKIGFNGVIYNRTTNATGQARLQINLLKPTLYTFAIAYLGDSKYQAAFEVAKITVKAQTPKLTTSSKTFKASAKTKSLSATLVSARGAAISGQKVSFTVNGKTYTGKTNSKGVATVNISLNKKGTYACTVKFAGMTGASAKTTKTAVKII